MNEESLLKQFCKHKTINYPWELAQHINSLLSEHSTIYVVRTLDTQGIIVRVTHRKKATIRQVTPMLSTSKNVLLQGHNHLLTTGADELTL